MLSTSVFYGIQLHLLTAWKILAAFFCVEFPKVSFQALLLFLLYIHDFENSAPLLNSHIFADDSNLFCTDTNDLRLEKKLNEQLILVNTWLCTNKLSIKYKKILFYYFPSIHHKKSLLCGYRSGEEGMYQSNFEAIRHWPV